MVIPEGYKQTEVGVIPEDWEVLPIKQIAPLQRGFDLPYVKIQDGHIPVVFSNGIGAYHNQYMVKGPGVVTGRSGTIGHIHYIESNYWPHNTSLWVTNFYGNYPKFIYYLFSTVGFEKYNSGSGVPTLNRNDIHDTKCPIPPVGEQKRIAHTLSNIEEFIVSLEKLLAKKKAIKQGAMQELLTGRRRLPGFSGEWKEYTLAELGDFSKGTGISRAEADSGKICAVRYGELYTQHINYVKKYYSHISEETASKAQRICFGDVLFAASGETKEEIGKCASIIDDSVVFAGGDIVVFRPRSPIHPIFLGYLLNTPKVQKQKSKKAQGDAIVHIHADSLQKIVISIPAYEEQSAIGEILKNMDDEIDELELKLSKYRRMKQGMMQQLLTGKIRLL